MTLPLAITLAALTASAQLPPMPVSEPLGPGDSAMVTVGWDANTEPNLAGYKVHWGAASRSYSTNAFVAAPVTQLAISNLTGGTYYFAVTALNTAGLESAYSDEIAWPTAITNVVTLYLTWREGTNVLALAPTNALMVSLTNPPGSYFWGEPKFTISQTTLR